MEQIYKSSLKLLVQLSPEETYKTIVQEALKLVNGKYGSILLEKDGALERVYANHQSLFKIIPRKRGFMYRVYKTKKPRILNYNQINTIHPSFKRIQAETDIIIPLSYRKQSLGVLTIMSKKGIQLVESDLLKLKYFGPLATLAIIKAQLLNETQSALETRDLFISMASHELKSPLTTISAYMQLIEKEHQSGEEIKDEWIETLSRELKRLTKLTNELLQVNQVKKGQLLYEKKKFNISNTVKNATNDFKLSYPERKIECIFSTDSKKSKIMGDENKITQVLINLIHNAAKHSQKTTTITVSVGKIDNSSIKIQIKDNGSGIAREDLEKVFDQFYRGRNNKAPGLGLGLYLSKVIIDEHSGNIEIDSELNRGTTVTVTLPASL